MNKPQETIADFKHRIALLMRNREGGKIYSVIGAARPDPCVVREYQPKTGEACDCKRGIERDNCPHCEGTGQKIDFRKIRFANAKPHGILKP